MYTTAFPARFTMLAVLSACLFAVPAETRADAVGVTGKTMKLVQKDSSPGGGKMVLLVKDENLDKGPGVDPLDIEALLEIAFDGQYSAVAMPAGALWTRNDADSADYKDPGAKDLGGVKRGKWKQNKVLKLVVVGLGSPGLDLSVPPVDPAAVAFTLRNGASADSFCTLFPDCEQRSNAKGTVHTLKCRAAATADLSCLAIPTTTTTSSTTTTSTTSTTTTSTTSTTTTTLDLFAGTTIMDSADQALLAGYYGSTAQHWEACYRRSGDGASASAFHTGCDGVGPTITVMETSDGYRFGGYTIGDWGGSGYYQDNGAFLFSLTHETRHSATITPQYAIYRSQVYGPTFGGGHDFKVSDDMTTGYTNFGFTYDCGVDVYGSTACREYLAGSYSSWTLVEVEVFRKVP